MVAAAALDRRGGDGSPRALSTSGSGSTRLPLASMFWMKPKRSTWWPCLLWSSDLVGKIVEEVVDAGEGKPVPAVSGCAAPRGEARVPPTAAVVFPPFKVVAPSCRWWWCAALLLLGSVVRSVGIPPARAAVAFTAAVAGDSLVASLFMAIPPKAADLRSANNKAPLWLWLVPFGGCLVVLESRTIPVVIV